MSLRDELQAIYDRHGQLTPALVVATAKKKDHPLHNRFEWDDAKAGEAWRRAQAQELIRSVKVTYREATETEQARSTRAFHAVRGEDGYAYQPAQVVAEDPFLRRLVLADMEREWKQLHRRYQNFAEFSAMVLGDMGEKAA